jgi:hypothetical protein
MTDDFDPHVYLANLNIGHIQTELNGAIRDYETAIRVNDEGSALIAQRDISRLQSEIDSYQNQAVKHLQSKQPVYAPPVSAEQRAMRRPEELDAQDLAKITGLDQRTYLNYKNYYDALKARKAID